MYKRIVVCVDGSETSQKALTAALQMARDSGGQVRIIHIIEELAQLVAYDPYGGYPGDLTKVLHDSGVKLLNDAMDIAKAAGVSAEQLLIESRGKRLADVVTQAAADFNADLLVVGTHGRRGMGRVLLGSGAEQIIRQAELPVLVIRSSETEEVKP
jgi:nucleotide-binding universal stress UspA family protein